MPSRKIFVSRDIPSKHVTIADSIVRFWLTQNDQQAIGSGPCVGFVGASMGGGIGRLEGLYGLIIDSLLSVRIMLPNTTVVEASAETNPDLFWGIRGAGVNFGFVLNATYRVYDEVPNGQNFNADFQLPYTTSKAFYEALKEEAPKMPAPLCIATSLQWDPKHNDVLISCNPAAYRCRSRIFDLNANKR